MMNRKALVFAAMCFGLVDKLLAQTCSTPGTFANIQNNCQVNCGFCDTCWAGYYCTGASPYAMTSCPAGTYNTATGSTSSSACTTCEAGYYCPAVTTASQIDGVNHFQCLNCPTNGYPSHVTCPSGSYCPAGSTSATACPTGYASSSDGTHCVICSSRGTSCSLKIATALDTTKGIGFADQNINTITTLQTISNSVVFTANEMGTTTLASGAPVAIYQLALPYGSFCLDIAAYNTGYGAYLAQWNCKDGTGYNADNQHFYFAPITDPNTGGNTFAIHTVIDGNVIDDFTSSLTVGNTVGEYYDFSYYPYRNQLWIPQWQ